MIKKNFFQRTCKSRRSIYHIPKLKYYMTRGQPFIKTHDSFKKNLVASKEHPTHDSLFRYTSYDPTQGDRIKAYCPTYPFPQYTRVQTQRQVYTTTETAPIRAALSWTSTLRSSSASPPSSTPSFIVVRPPGDGSPKHKQEKTEQGSLPRLKRLKSTTVI